jgi:hypothetical protein
MDIIWYCNGLVFLVLREGWGVRQGQTTINIHIVSYPKFVHTVNLYKFSRAPYAATKIYFYVTFAEIQIALKRKKLIVYFKRIKCVSSMYYDYIFIKHLKTYCFPYSQINQQLISIVFPSDTSHFKYPSWWVSRIEEQRRIMKKRTQNCYLCCFMCYL